MDRLFLAAAMTLRKRHAFALLRAWMGIRLRPELSYLKFILSLSLADNGMQGSHKVLDVVGSSLPSNAAANGSPCYI
jgi:hypothetical protein